MRELIAYLCILVIAVFIGTYGVLEMIRWHDSKEIRLWLSYSKNHVALQRLKDSDRAYYPVIIFEDDIQERLARGTEIIIKWKPLPHPTKNGVVVGGNEAKSGG